MAPEDVFFFLPGAGEDLARLSTLDVDRDWRAFATGLSVWVLQTYLRLRERGVPVRLTGTVPGHGALVVHAHSVPAADWADVPASTAVVVVRADKAPQRLADVEIVQNGRFADGRRRLAVPHWPQPGLVPRDANRGATVRAAAFKGHLKSLNPALRSPEWAAFLEGHGISWHDDAAPFGGPGRVYDEVAWNDYSGVDVVVAVRPAWAGAYPTKPASKLVNAWLAGVPAVLGPEHAYRELRRTPLDYVEVRSLAEARGAVEGLASGGAPYDEIVANGRQRAQAHTVEATAQRWCEVLFEDLPRALGGRLLPARRRLLRAAVGPATRLRRAAGARGDAP